MERNKEIIIFINRFRGSEEVFLHGCCFWFAFILHERFGLNIGYEPVEGHFLASEPGIFHKPDGTQYYKMRRYDIRGDVTDKYDGQTVYSVEWLSENEPGWYEHILRDCRDFASANDEALEVSA